jgi:hypothetical protein
LAIGASLAACQGGGSSGAAAPAPAAAAASDARIPLFSSPSLAWNQDVSAAQLDPASGAILGWLSANGGWGNGKMAVDFSLSVLTASAGTPLIPLLQLPGYEPDCDSLAQFPLPTGGAAEGSADYACFGGDCHVLVVDKAGGFLYESEQSSLGGGKLSSACAVRWDLSKAYSATLRGDQCASADSSGLPLAALLFTADEVAAGEIRHAIRLILPASRIQAGVFVRPATHAGSPAGPSSAIPFGARLRLKASYDISSLKPAARVVARAMQKYGTILADSGNIALTAASDVYKAHKWADLGFASQDLVGLGVLDFEMVDAGARIPLTYACAKN